MHHAIAPIAVRPWTLNGLSERLLVSHYEHHYGSAVRTVNAIRSELARLDPGAPDYQLGALKRQGYVGVGLERWSEILSGRYPWIAGRAVCLTFDDGTRDFLEHAHLTLRETRLGHALERLGRDS